MDRFRWPDGKTAAAAFTFDVDAESAILWGNESVGARMSVMSHQAYGPLVGIPRILDLLEQHQVPSTFFVPGHTFTILVHIAQVILCRCVSLFSSFSEPYHSQVIIFIDSAALIVHITKIVLSFCIPLVSSFTVPHNRLTKITSHTNAITIHITKFVLGSFISLFCRFAIPPNCLSFVFGNP